MKFRNFEQKHEVSKVWAEKRYFEFLSGKWNFQTLSVKRNIESLGGKLNFWAEWRNFDVLSGKKKLLNFERKKEISFSEQKFDVSFLRAKYRSFIFRSKFQNLFFLCSKFRNNYFVIPLKYSVFCPNFRYFFFALIIWKFHFSSIAKGLYLAWPLLGEGSTFRDKTFLRVGLIPHLAWLLPRICWTCSQSFRTIGEHLYCIFWKTKKNSFFDV